MMESRMESGVVSRRNIEMVRGYGASLWDSEGREYIDMGASYGVCNVGHCNEDVKRRIKDQIDRIMYISSSYDNPARRELMSMLIDISPPGMDRVFLCNSGTEAVESALKFSMHLTGKKKIIAARRSFHGRTTGSMSVTWNTKTNKNMTGALIDVDFVGFGNCQDLSEYVKDDVAALILEPVQGEGGVHPAPPGYLSFASEICRKNGALLIIDEVQTGMGRTGKMFALEREGIVPDLMCIGKSLGGGLPIAATMINGSLGPLPRGYHGSTFGGNPTTCAAAIAVIENIKKNRLCDRSLLGGQKLLYGLKAIDSPLIREVRGIGLMVAVELKKKAGPYLSRMVDQGIAAIPAGATVIRLLPPLVITDEQIDRTVSVMREVLDG